LPKAYCDIETIGNEIAKLFACHQLQRKFPLAPAGRSL